VSDSGDPRVKSHVLKYSGNNGGNKFGEFCYLKLFFFPDRCMVKEIDTYSVDEMLWLSDLILRLSDETYCWP